MAEVVTVRVSRVGGRKGDSFLSPELQQESIKRVCQPERRELVDVVEELDRPPALRRSRSKCPRKPPTISS